MRKRRHISIIVLTTLLPALLLSSSPPSAQAAGIKCYTFAENANTICGLFLRYWQQHDGLALLGLPISGEMSEVSATDGKIYTVQYFERAALELHPENHPPYDVLPELMGTIAYKQAYHASAPGQRPDPAPDTVRFATTGKRVGGVFLRYWQTQGGLQQFGYPISEEFTEESKLDGKQYRVQYFERAEFEYHPEQATAYQVLLAQLGTFEFQKRYPLPTAPSDPWTPLESRPLKLPTLTPGAICPRSPAKQVSPDFGLALGDGPIYPVGLGADASVSYSGAQAEGGWYFVKVLWVGDPTYQGPILVRGHQIDGGAELASSAGPTRLLNCDSTPLRVARHLQAGITGLRTPACVRPAATPTRWTVSASALWLSLAPLTVTPDSCRHSD